MNHVRDGELTDARGGPCGERGNLEAAFCLLEMAADSFASIDPLERAQRRASQYWFILRNHGHRYGGLGLSLSRRLLAPILISDLRQQAPSIWATAQNNLAISLQEQGGREKGEKSADLFSQAVTAFGEALQFRSRSHQPIEWAATRNNLAVTLYLQATREKSSKGVELLGRSISAHRSLLEIHTQSQHPEKWTITQHNLAIALQELGLQTEDEPGVALLAEAVRTFHAALEVHTRANYPIDWAKAQSNLGIALAYQGKRTSGPSGVKLIAQGVTAFRKALDVRTREDHPVAWAMTVHNIAETLLQRSMHEASANPKTDLTDALESVMASLEVTMSENVAYLHNENLRLRDEIQTALDALD